LLKLIEIGCVKGGSAKKVNAEQIVGNYMQK